MNGKKNFSKQIAKQASREKARSERAARAAARESAAAPVVVGSWQFEEDDNGDLVVTNTETGTTIVLAIK